MVPMTGGAFTHTAVAPGEFASWIVAICLVSGYAVSVSWSYSVQTFFREFSIVFSPAFGVSPIGVSGDSLILTGGTMLTPRRCFERRSVPLCCAWGFLRPPL
ncbi:cationic amino acid transporter [Trypanosoma rangeli]|uniref:Cationic amino acid transporter n=1 Tax=Trypanosoma rangeli TaxID=5698 RepID=A0A3R7LC05_TRYRA|nr:cationic amino acid transporter [Trypanosoma rangeli]RNF11345.1 cationic amino acid transporter [Trypanosoma rangeli]|eukprot:RNF11345.1 cationic amino acid transporter [Trypanosoma rangeli]